MKTIHFKITMNSYPSNTSAALKTVLKILKVPKTDPGSRRLKITHSANTMEQLN